MSTAAELTELAETHLLLANFVQADSVSRQALQRAVYLGDEGLKDRAACVAIQALAETQRFASASRLLKDSFGPRLEDAPPHALLLWLALALDTEARREAQQLLQDLLDRRQPGGEAGWTRRHYLQLVHLYAFEVLLKELGEAAAVMRWVRDTELQLDSAERQLLLDELAAEAARRGRHAAQRDAQPPAAQRRGSGGGGGGGSRRSSRPTTAAGASVDGSSREEAQQRAQPPRTSQAAGQQGRAGGKAAAGARVSFAAAGTGDVAAAEAPAAPAGEGSEIVPAPLDEGQAVPGALEWLSRCQQQAAAALGALLQPLLPAAAQHGGTRPGAQPAMADPAATLRLLGGTCLGAILLYAAYAERQAIRRGARSARRGVLGALGDLARMALSLQLNPLAASAPAWR